MATGQRQLYRFQQVEVQIHRARAVVADHRVLQAAYRCVFVHVALVDQVLHARFLGLAHQPGHRALVKVQQERCTLAGRDHVDKLVVQRVGRAAVQPHVRLGLQDRRHLVDDLQHSVGQIVGQVGPSGTHARERNELAVP